MYIKKIYKVKKTGVIFTTNYIDYYNNVICIGDYNDKSNKIIKLEDVEEYGKMKVKDNFKDFIIK